MSIDKPYGKSFKMSGIGMSGSGGGGAPPGSYGARFYGVPYVFSHSYTRRRSRY